MIGEEHGIASLSDYLRGWRQQHNTIAIQADAADAAAIKAAIEKAAKTFGNWISW